MSQIYNPVEISHAGLVASLTGDVGGAIVPVGGNIDVLGGVNITTTGTAGTITIDLVATIAVALGGTGGTTHAIHGVLVGQAGAAIASTVAGTTGNVLTGVTGADPAWAQVDLTSMVTGILPVPNGGTGLSTILDHGVMVGSGVGAVTPLVVGTDGQVLVGDSANDPVFATLGSTLGTVQYDLGAGTLALDVQTAQSFSGFASWDGAGPYFDDTVLGDFEVSESGVGYIRGQRVTWAAPQTETGMTAGNTYLIYIDDTGTIGKTTVYNMATFRDYIVLFECMRDSTAGTNLQVTVKENHPYQVPWETSVYLHDVIGVAFTANGGGANIIIDGTQKIAISGADELEDHGLETDIPDSGGTGVTWHQYFTLVSGKWSQNSSTDTFIGEYNNAGTATALGGNKFCVYTLYASKDNINTTTPVYFAVLDTAQYNTSNACQAAINNGLTAIATSELAKLEMGRLGHIVYGEAADAIVDVLIDKETIGTGGTSAGTNQASLVLTDVTNFDGWLSAANTSVQSALETLDDTGGTATDNAVILGRGVGVPFAATAVGTTNNVLTGVTGNDPAWAQVALASMVTGTLPVGNGGTGAVTFTDGGLLVGATTGPIEALAVGGTGTILTGVAGANPTWTTATYPATATKGDIISASAANVFTAITAGTDDHVLVANGAGEVSTYQYSHALPITIADKADTYALVEGDEGKMITMSKATAQTLTVPKDATNDLPIGSQILVMQLGAGALTIAAEDGTIVLRYDAALTLVLNAQYAVAALVKIAANLWVVGGNLTPA